MAVPWTQDLFIDDTEFDVAWRVIFGGMTSVMTERIDHPEHGFRWRDERMDWAFARALHLIASRPGPRPQGRSHHRNFVRSAPRNPTSFSDPSDDAHIQATITTNLATAVVEPIRRLTREVDAGARNGTAFSLLHRYILPVLAYHQGAWGLVAVAEVWREVDEALDEVCVALCPDDLRGCLSHDSALRLELALPRGNGGLGIPHVATEAPIRQRECGPGNRRSRQARAVTSSQ